MKKEQAIEVLKKEGMQVEEIDGIVTVIYKGPEKALGKTFTDACRIAKAAGYKGSIGIHAHNRRER